MSIYTLAQQDTIVYVDLHGLQAQVKTFDFDSDGDPWDIRIASRNGDYMGPSLFEVTNYLIIDSPWRICIRTNYGDAIPDLNEWSQNFQHVYLYQGAVHEEFLTALRKKLSDDNYCYGWIRYRVDAGDEISGELGTITFYEYCFALHPTIHSMWVKPAWIGALQMKRLIFPTLTSTPTPLRAPAPLPAKT